MSVATRRRSLRLAARASPTRRAPPRAAPPSDALVNALSSGGLSRSGLKRRRVESPEPGYDTVEPEHGPAESEHGPAEPEHGLAEPEHDTVEPAKPDQVEDVIVVDLNRSSRPLPRLAASPAFVKKEDQDEVSPGLATPPKSSSKKRVSFSTPPNANGEARDALSSPPRKRIRRLGTPWPMSVVQIEQARAGNWPYPTVSKPPPPRLWSNCIPNSQKGLAEINSINELVQQAAWKHTLCIEPLLWTRNQCRLLSCQFKHDMEEQNRLFPPDWWVTKGLSKGDAYQMHVDVRGQLRNTDEKLKALFQVLRENDFEVLGDPHGPAKHLFASPLRWDLSVIYHNKSYGNVAADAIFLHTAGKDSYALAYVDLDDAHASRRQNLHTAPISFRDGQHPSAFVGLGLPSPEKPRHDAEKPRHEAEDPYIVAVLIALAQKQRQDESRRPRRQRGVGTRCESRTSSLSTDAEPAESQVDVADTCYKVRVVAIPEKAKYLYFYKASFPSKFLQKFDDPSKYVPSDWVTISFFRAPLREKLNICEMLTPTMEQILWDGASSRPSSERQ